MLLTSVRPDVHLERVRPTKSPLTYLTPVRPFSAVRPVVIDKLVCLGKRSLADTTFIRTLAGMTANVALHNF